MKIVCAPLGYPFADQGDDLQVVLYDQPDRADRGSAGQSIMHRIRRKRFVASPRAWDFLSLALAACTADLAGDRDNSADGWTRELELTVAVSEPEFWNANRDLITKALSFLTTDRWHLRFEPGGFLPEPRPSSVASEADCVTLLSGGLDSLVGAIDLVAEGRRPMAVSQVVRGDAKKQRAFANRLGNLDHLLLNHVATPADMTMARSQRARSMVFIAYGVFAATTLARYHAGETVPVFICENGFIAINPPLTQARLGSLSTRTAHPVFLGYLQSLFEQCGLRVNLVNPYRLKTKGEMLRSCRNQELLRELAVTSTSCSKFLRFNYKHCGRCVPCQIRRASFLAWNIADTTSYMYTHLGRDDEEHSRFDDVRSAGMAILTAREDGLSEWVGNALSTALLDDVAPLEAVVGRGLAELEALHRAYNIT